MQPLRAVRHMQASDVARDGWDSIGIEWWAALHAVWTRWVRLRNKHCQWMPSYGNRLSHPCAGAAALVLCLSLCWHTMIELCAGMLDGLQAGATVCAPVLGNWSMAALSVFCRAWAGEWEAE